MTISHSGLLFWSTLYTGGLSSWWLSERSPLGRQPPIKFPGGSSPPNSVVDTPMLDAAIWPIGVYSDATARVGANDRLRLR